MDVASTQEVERSHVLGAEAARLMDFKRQNVRNTNQTLCPQCANLVHVQAQRCPQCTSDVSEHTRQVRDGLQKLTEVTRELSEMYQKDLESLREGAGERSRWSTIKEHLGEAAFLRSLRIVLPSLIGLFVAILFLKARVSGLVFLVGSAGGAFLAYSLFDKWDLRKPVTVDLYRLVLFLGVMIILITGMPFDSGKFWPETTAASVMEERHVEVEGRTVNIREAPTTDSDVLIQVSQGDKLKVLEERESWYRIETASGSTGWIYANLVK